ncbi:BREX-1 system adenine-specific DNA-methyltransferase PglX [Lysinibacillus telephonicus]|uniref:site-specific DNA-methyltransferase (adenine-specific) n=1 Tax=Lysinibacillus telephonicus TaxID=1714840 RepID=A0A3S0JXH1_9BACI|nr:BREX-1 system adenine-specific DNA-methyltransferase PglX [Lysinibacillus telephonicus]RTQ93679.1 BREX-1 system adenine-specific DNA-methyltransferase PglX [Lysinibacillus telephonicus]
MNKSALKKFATEARIELLEKVELQARKIGITAESIQKANVESSDAVFIDGRQLSDLERRQRNKLIARINEIGFERVMEETAYTWFNRFIALRFMEVNDYLPTKVRVLSSSNNDSAEPDMMKEALSLDLELDKEYVYDLKMNNKTDELFKYLIKMHCNDLNRYMPFMFETLEDYKEILFPEGLLGTDSFVRQMTNTDVIAESDWENVEIIGWLYQYYISEEKDEVFANLKKNIKITKDKLPAATQLFTPNWIVRFMVENSLGQIWLESYPNSLLKNQWKYFIDEAQQEEETKKQLGEIRYQNVNPEEITFLDPCCGSGHILVYAFDVFYEMYLEKGYMENEIPQLILSKNLFGLDVDDRAVQLASFAVMMKAREKSRRIFRNAIKPNIYAVQESNWLTDEMIDSIANNNDEVKENLKVIKDTFINAKEYGSLLSVDNSNFDLLKNYYEKYKSEEVNLFEFIDKEVVVQRLPTLINQVKLLSKKYDIICTNPPYMGKSGMNSSLVKFLDSNYPDSKNDLFATFIERGFGLLKKHGFNSMVTMQSWMFLSSYEKLRKKIIDQKTITTLLHMDNMVMGIAFGTSATVFRNVQIKKYKGNYTEVKYKDIQLGERPKKFPILENRNSAVSVENFNKIPGSPIAYWANESHYEAYGNAKLLKEISEIKKGLATGNTDLFIKYWFEVPYHNISFDKNESKWYPCHKGGGYRKWYGNLEKVIYWENDGFEIKNYKDSKGKLKSRPQNLEYMLRRGITFSKITSSGSSCRLMTGKEFFDDAVQGIFINDDEVSVEYLLAVLNSSVIAEFLKILNPTLNKQIYDLERVPVIISDKYDQILDLANKAIEISKNEWDERETSWNFTTHLFNRQSVKDLKSYFENLKALHATRKSKLLEIENEINNILLESYKVNINKDYDSLQDESFDSDEIVNLNEKDTIIGYISYFIGITFGRYSLDKEGLIYAGGKFDPLQYKTFPADEDNILPILPGAYFEDDIVTRFIDFVRVTFSEETLKENLDFIADAIGRKANETARETLRRYFLNDFYKDHVQVYKKRPIYWLFTSGKEKAFNCLIYMHRYDKTTLSRIRTDYLHEVQIRMDAEKKDLLTIIEGDYSAKEISNAKKELKSLDKKIDELKAYDELLHHMADMQIEIDLDDGVKVNYEKFKGLVAKI